MVEARDCGLDVDSSIGHEGRMPDSGRKEQAAIVAGGCGSTSLGVEPTMRRRARSVLRPEVPVPQPSRKDKQSLKDREHRRRCRIQEDLETGHPVEEGQRRESVQREPQ